MFIKYSVLFNRAADTKHTVCADEVTLRLNLTAEYKYSRCIYVHSMIINIYTDKKDLKSTAYFGIARILYKAYCLKFNPLNTKFRLLYFKDPDRTAQ